VQAVDAAGTHIVVGGEGMQPSLWDLSTGSKVWQGKGGKPNRVGLVDKPFPTAAAFLPSSAPHAQQAAAAEAGTSGQDEEGPSISRRFVIGSAVAKLHVYDTAAGKRPQQEAVFGESRVTALAVTPDGERSGPLATSTEHVRLVFGVCNCAEVQDTCRTALIGSSGLLGATQWVA
jgi:ribosome biogenesis protein NSA1